MSVAAVQLVILLSVGQFQASAPGALREPSALYPDTAEGARQFVGWLSRALPPPKFAQPPMRVCVVGAVPFSAQQAPVLTEQVWSSMPPWRQLEPYEATFHYAEPPAAGAKPAAPRTLRDAERLCAAAAKQKVPSRFPTTPPAPAAAASGARPAPR